MPTYAPTVSPQFVPSVIMAVVIPFVFIVAVVIVILRLLKRKRRLRSKVGVESNDYVNVVPSRNDDDDNVNTVKNDIGKFDSPTQYFKLGGVDDYQVLLLPQL